MSESEIDDVLSDCEKTLKEIKAKANDIDPIAGALVLNEVHYLADILDFTKQRIDSYEQLAEIKRTFEQRYQ